MSPGLHQWVTDKFGLEMTRVIEDYSNFTAPKLSPELLSVVDRIVPTNYQGNDVNLYFKQLFDVGCGPNPTQCFYYAEYVSIPDNTFNFWTINGNSFNLEIGLITGNASDTLNPTNSFIVADSRFPWALAYDISSLPSVPTALDSFGNPSTPVWQQGGCVSACYELLVPKTDLLFQNLNFGIPLTNAINCIAFFGVGYGLDVSNASQIAVLDGLYKSMFGVQAEVTSTLDVNGDYIIRINNTYEIFSPIWDNTTIGSLYFYEVPC